MAAVAGPEGDAAIKLNELFMQLKEEIVGEKKVDEKIFRAHLLASIKQSHESKVDDIINKRMGVFVLVVILVGVLAAVVGDRGGVYKRYLIAVAHNTRCLVKNNLVVKEFFRPVYNCEMCRNISRIERIANISRQEFLEKYAYSTVPVVIAGAANGWKAMDSFSYLYFKNLYTEDVDVMNHIDRECQFINWGYHYDSIEEVFNMTEAKTKLEPGPGDDSWYVGWFNCHYTTSYELRSQIQRPYFLPDESETIFWEWIFMGWSGPGAFLHIDAVRLPSWQAQISGRKKWTFVPVLECAGICKDKLEVIVEKGDIIVFDSNKWFHSTFVLPGEFSITIGLEYN